MKFTRDEMLQSYGMDSEFPEKWSDTGLSGMAMDTLTQTDAQADPDQAGGALLNQLLGQLSVDAAVAADDKDPLGSTSSIMAVLQSRGVNPSSPAERARYMPSSVQFDPTLFLKNVHTDASMSDLENGLLYLKDTLAGTAQGLRQVVDTDYESFVASKRRLDEVMNQLKGLKVDGKSDYGLKHLRELLEAASNSMIGYAQPLDMQANESRKVQNALKYLEAHRQLFELPQVLEKYAAADDHEKFLREYKAGRRALNDLVSSSRSRQVSKGRQSDEARLASKLQSRVETILETYRQGLREKLLDTGADEAYSLVLAKLVDLGFENNPALEWLNHNIERFNDDISDIFNRIMTTATRNAADSSELGERLELTSYLRQLHADETVQEACDRLDEMNFVDSEEITTQWSGMVSLFDSLRRSLGRACVFYREFISLSQNPSASKWAISPQQTDEVTQQCLKLVNMASEKLVESLTVPVSRTSTLPIASAHAAGSDAADGSGPLSIMPLNSNSLSAAKYLSRIIDGLSSMLDDVSELMGPQNALSEGVARAKKQFVKALCQCWSRDALNFGDIQDWTNSATLPTYFVLFHGVTIERLRYLLDANRGGPPSAPTIALIGRTFPAALSLSVRSLESSLVDMTKSTTSSVVVAQIETQLQPHSLSQDVKLLVILDHLETLKERSLEQIYSQYESVFRQSARIQDVRRQVTPDLDKISSQLFDIYIRKKRSRISQVVQQEIQRLEPQWSESDKEVTNVSNYVYENLMVLVEIHALFMETCPRMARRAILELYNHLLVNVLGALRNIDSLSRFGILQNVTDLEFMRWAMSSLTETRETCQKIFDAIKDASRDLTVWSNQDGPRGFVRNVLDEAVRQDQFAFSSFKTLEKPTA